MFYKHHKGFCIRFQLHRLKHQTLLKYCDIPKSSSKEERCRQHACVMLFTPIRKSIIWWVQNVLFPWTFRWCHFMVFPMLNKHQKSKSFHLKSLYMCQVKFKALETQNTFLFCYHKAFLWLLHEHQAWVHLNPIDKVWQFLKCCVISL